MNNRIQAIVFADFLFRIRATAQVTDPVRACNCATQFAWPVVRLSQALMDKQKVTAPTQVHEVARGQITRDVEEHAGQYRPGTIGERSPQESQNEIADSQAGELMKILRRVGESEYDTRDADCQCRTEV